MNENIIGIAHQAKLSKKIQEIKIRNDRQINNIVELLEKIKGAGVSKNEEETILKSTLITLITYYEAYLFETLSAIYHAFPLKMTGDIEKYSVKDFMKNGSIMYMIHEEINKKIQSLFFKGPNDVLNEYFKITGISLSDKDFIQKLIEFKATRDIFIHTEGKVNAKYIDKAVKFARANYGDRLPIDESYINNVSLSIKEFIKKIDNLLMEKYSKYTKSKAFKEMWEATHLNEVLSFEEAWTLDIEKDYIHVTEKAFKWGWSGSEKPVFDFFLNVYGNKDEFDILRIFQRYPYPHKEKLMVMAWLESPFRF